MPGEPDNDGTVSFKDYVDARFAEVRRAVELASTAASAMQDPSVSLREYVEAILEEQRRGMIVAEQEREKAAQALASALADQIDSGDSALRDHIEQQVEHLRLAQAAAAALGEERLVGMIERIDSVRRETAIVFKTSEEAISKAEDAINRRLDLLNEFRAQASDEASKYALRETVDGRIAELTMQISLSLPREVAEAQIAELRRSITDLSAQVGKLV